MPVDPALAALYFRVQMAGASAEQAISFLNQREVLRGRMAVQSVVLHLTAARNRLKDSGQNPERLAYVEQLIVYYSAAMNTILRPAAAPGVAKSLADNQGNLYSASPL